MSGAKKTNENDRQGLMDQSVRTNRDSITAEVLQALRQGDHSAYERVYRKYVQKITTFIHSMVRSFEEAEELTQEVFTTLWSNREKIDPAKNFNNYLYTLAKFNILNYFRARKIHESYIQEAKHVNIDELTTQTDDTLYAQETGLLVELTVSKMPARRREVYEMSRNEGLSNEEIARRLGITKNAVEKHLTFALKDIREILTLFLLLFAA